MPTDVYFERLWESQDNFKLRQNMVTQVPLNVDKIQSLADVKRVLKFLDIQVGLQEGITRKGFDEVKDLFER